MSRATRLELCLRGGPRHNGAKRSGDKDPLANITTAEWRVTFGSNDKILEMKTQSFGYNVIGWECLPLVIDIEESL